MNLYFINHINIHICYKNGKTYISETYMLSATSMVADVLYCVINEMAGASCNSQRLNV